MGNVKFHTMGILWEKTSIFPYCGIWIKVYWISNPTQFPDMGN